MRRYVAVIIVVLLSRTIKGMEEHCLHIRCTHISDVQDQELTRLQKCVHAIQSIIAVEGDGIRINLYCSEQYITAMRLKLTDMGFVSEDIEEVQSRILINADDELHEEDDINDEINSFVML
jgi:hypothetical protein